MSDKPAKPKKSARSAKPEASVLGSLPATRPTRLGRRAPADGETTAAAKPKATKASAAAKPKAAKPKAAKAKAAKPARPAAPRRPTPPPPPPEPPRRSGPPSGTELVTTAVQAAGELVEIGLGAGARALRRAAQRVTRG